MEMKVPDTIISAVESGDLVVVSHGSGKQSYWCAKRKKMVKTVFCLIIFLIVEFLCYVKLLSNNSLTKNNIIE